MGLQLFRPKTFFQISLLFLNILFFFFFLQTTFAFAETLCVKGDKVNMRTGPGIQYKIKWEYGNGFPFEIVRMQDDWAKVKDFENDSGWIHRSLLQQKPMVIVKVSKDKEKSINIRSGPGIDNPIIGNAFHGVVFAKLDVKGDWVKVQHESGLVGWITKTLLWGN